MCMATMQNYPEPPSMHKIFEYAVKIKQKMVYSDSGAEFTILDQTPVQDEKAIQNPYPN